MQALVLHVGEPRNMGWQFVAVDSLHVPPLPPQRVSAQAPQADTRRLAGDTAAFTELVLAKPWVSATAPSMTPTFIARFMIRIFMLVAPLAVRY